VRCASHFISDADTGCLSSAPYTLGLEGIRDEFAEAVHVAELEEIFGRRFRIDLSTYHGHAHWHPASVGEDRGRPATGAILGL
jgi:hypothetical protein